MGVDLRSRRFLTPSDQVGRLYMVPGNPYAPTRPMAWGEVGSAVRAIQQSLIDLGYRLPASTAKYGSPDGIFGDETKAALRAFQLDHQKQFRLTPTGILDQKTLLALDQMFQQPGAIPLALPPLPAGSWLTHRITVAYRRVTDTPPQVPLNQLLAQARYVYEMYGIRIDQEPTTTPQLTRSERYKLGPYETYCNPDESKETESQRLLYSLESRTGSPALDNLSAAFRPKILFQVPVRRSGAGSRTVLAYIAPNVYAVNDATKKSDEVAACSSHRPYDPLTVLSATKLTRWTLAHELGHVLLGRSFKPSHSSDTVNLMVYSTMLLIEPAILNEEQVRAMRQSPFCERIR